MNGIPANGGADQAGQTISFGGETGLRGMRRRLSTPKEEFGLPTPKTDVACEILPRFLLRRLPGEKNRGG